MDVLGITCKTEFSRLPRYLMQNMDWLDEELGGYEDDYLIIDCPGKSSPLSTRSSPEGNNTRADRVVHSPSISSISGQTLEPAGPPSMCALPHRIAIHGGQIQILQVSFTLTSSMPKVISSDTRYLQWCYVSHVSHGQS